MSRISLLVVAAAALFSLASAGSPPKVLALDVKKEIRRDVPSNPEQLIRRAKSMSVGITNEQSLYLINITIGNPPRQFGLQLDTGSSDTWVPSADSILCLPRRACALGAYDSMESSTFVPLDPEELFRIAYQDNSQVSGIYFKDTLNIGAQSIKNMQMGLADRASRDLGILGIGFRAGESVASPSDQYPNIVNQLKDQGVISTLAYSLWLNNDNVLTTGSIIFGGVDTEKYHGDLTILPIQRDSRPGAKPTFTVVLDAVSVVNEAGKSQFAQDSLALPVILDSGTTVTLLPDNLADAIAKGVGASSHPAWGQLVPCSLQDSGAVISFTFGGPNGPVIQVAIAEFVLSLASGGSAPAFPDREPACAWGIQGSGNAPILFGDTFLRSAYVVYHLESEQIGIAQTNFNVTKTNVVEISGSDIPGASSTATGAAAPQTYSGRPLQTVVTAAVSGQISSGPSKPTFSMGTSAAMALRVPSIGMATLTISAVIALSFCLGVSMVIV
ncbi:hypothetical protein MMC07_000461 [Pseudocyphellaria aurata]|nr:hypothetical protein [Pseudocyphellaria aurata]